MFLFWVAVVAWVLRGWSQRMHLKDTAKRHQGGKVSAVTFGE